MKKVVRISLFKYNDETFHDESFIDGSQTANTDWIKEDEDILKIDYNISTNLVLVACGCIMINLYNRVWINGQFLKFKHCVKNILLWRSQQLLLTILQLKNRYWKDNWTAISKSRTQYCTLKS